MPYHALELNLLLYKALNVLKPKRVIDVGVGNGAIAWYLREKFPGIHLTGIEIWEPYVMIFGLKSLYDVLHIQDARTFPIENERADLVILGDVLEHMTKEEGWGLLVRCAEAAPHIIITTPKGYLEQQSYAGNIYETHICGYDPEELRLELRRAGYPSDHGLRECALTFIVVGCREPSCLLDDDIFRQ